MESHNPVIIQSCSKPPTSVGNHGFYQFIRGVSLENPRDHKPRWDSPATIDDTGKKGMLRNIFSISIINIIRYIYREHQGYMIYIYI